jgi:hypothetical protein
MKRINLLPEHYASAKRSRRRGWLLLAACMPLLAGTAFAWHQARQRLDGLEAHVGSVEDQVAIEQKRQDVSKRLAAEAGKLRQTLAVKQSVTLPLPSSAALALLSNLTPETVQLGRVSLDAAAAVQARPGEARKPLRLELEGDALGDQDVGRYVSLLTTHPLFRNVKLSAGRYVVVAGVNRFHFVIEAEVPIDREFVMPRQEVAQP